MPEKSCFPKRSHLINELKWAEEDSRVGRSYLVDKIVRRKENYSNNCIFFSGGVWGGGSL